MNIAISGAGVAGVASAIALTQHGFRVSIYERRASASTIGAGIVIWPNAAYVLEQLGLLQEIAAVAGRPALMRRFSSENENLGAIDIELINQHMGYPSLSILRRDFQALLIAKLQSMGIHIHYDHEVIAIDSSSDHRAQLQFANGSTITADLVIGADGRMASRARQYVNHDNTPIYQGFINWIGVYESDRESIADLAVADYWGVGARFGMVPINSHSAYWAAGIASTEIGERNPSAYREELAAVFANWPQAVQTMIAHTPVQQMNKIYLHDHDPVPTWHRHKLLMIGDAAHAPLPTSGQGACQALEDAWQLADCLRHYPDEPARAFVEFTQRRYEKTSNIIIAARQFARSLFNTDKAFCKTRNEASKNTDFNAVAWGMAQGWSQQLPLMTNS